LRVEYLPDELDTNGLFPACFVIPQEPDFVAEYLMNDSVLQYVLLILDNKKEGVDGAESKYIRFRNVKADIIKHLKLDSNFGGMIDNVQVVNSGHTNLGDINQDSYFVYVDIYRTVDAKDPYNFH
jgi:hypothetical protein